jgi:hypothetical protein
MLALWAGVMAGPMAWAADLVVGYALVPWTCAHQNQVPLHAVSLAALLVIAAGTWTSWRALNITSERSVTSSGSGVLDGGALVIERAQFLAALGLASSALFTIVVIATEVPRWMFDACR